MFLIYNTAYRLCRGHGTRPPRSSTGSTRPATVTRTTNATREQLDADQPHRRRHHRHHRHHRQRHRRR